MLLEQLINFLKQLGLKRIYEMTLLTGGDLEGTYFVMAKLNDADFTDADLGSSDLGKAQLSGANFTRAYLGLADKKIFFS